MAAFASHSNWKLNYFRSFSGFLQWLWLFGYGLIFGTCGYCASHLWHLIPDSVLLKKNYFPFWYILFTFQIRDIFHHSNLQTINNSCDHTQLHNIPMFYVCRLYNTTDLLDHYLDFGKNCGLYQKGWKNKKKNTVQEFYEHIFKITWLCVVK